MDGPPGVVTLTILFAVFINGATVTVAFICPGRDLMMLTLIPSGGVKLMVLGFDRLEPLIRTEKLPPPDIWELGEIDSIEGADALSSHANPIERKAANSALVMGWSGQKCSPSASQLLFTISIMPNEKV